MSRARLALRQLALVGTAAIALTTPGDRIEGNVSIPTLNVGGRVIVVKGKDASG